MTIICAYKDARTDMVWIGSDHQRTMYELHLPGPPKWFRNGTWAIGHAGDLRAMNVLEFSWKRITDEASNIFEITTALRDMLRNDQYRPQEDNNDFPLYGQNFIITDSRTIWDISGRFSHTELMGDRRFIANGSGFRLAYGAYHALSRQPGVGGEQIIRGCIEAAIEYDRDCGHGVWMDSLPTPT